MINFGDVTKKRPDIDKIYLYTKYPYKAKNKLLINKREVQA